MLTVDIAISVFRVKVQYVPIKLTYVKHAVTLISTFNVMAFTSCFFLFTNTVAIHLEQHTVYVINYRKICIVFTV